MQDKLKGIVDQAIAQINESVEMDRLNEIAHAGKNLFDFLIVACIIYQELLYLSHLVTIR